MSEEFVLSVKFINYDQNLKGQDSKNELEDPTDVRSAKKIIQKNIKRNEQKRNEKPTIKYHTCLQFNSPMNYLSYICTLHTEIKSFIFSIIIMKYPDRIPFEERINSQLSVAKHY